MRWWKIDYVRNERKPVIVHAHVPLLGHHEWRAKEWYRDDLEDTASATARCPAQAAKLGIAIEALDTIQTEVTEAVEAA